MKGLLFSQAICLEVAAVFLAVGEIFLSVWNLVCFQLSVIQRPDAQDCQQLPFRLYQGHLEGGEGREEIIYFW